MEDFKVDNKVKFEYKGKQLEGTISRIYNSGYTASIVSGKSMYTMPICAIKHVTNNNNWFENWNEIINGQSR